MIVRKGLYITALAALAVAGVANASSVWVGPCHGEIAPTGFGKAGNCTVEAALILPAETLAPYAGAEITAVRVGLSTSAGMEDFTVWIRPSLEGEALDTATATPDDGWNEVSLSGGITVDGSPLAVGFGFSQAKSVKCISAVGASQPDGLWVAKNGAWEVPSGKTGVLSVQLVVSSPSIPEADIALGNVRLEPHLLKPGETGNIVFSVVNESTTPVEGFDWEYTLGGKTVTLHSNLTIAPSGIATETAEISAEGLEPDMAHDIGVRLRWDADGNTANDTGSCRLICWETATPRRVLIEEFTTEHCPNCPRAINTLEQCFEHGYGDSMAVIAHHVGYYEDWLTVEADGELLWFYDPTGASGTYAPAVMLDRTVSGGNSVPVESIGYYDTFEARLQQAIAEPAFVAVSAKASLDGDVVNIEVNAEALPVFNALCLEPRVNVFIVEDGILHHDQAGIQSDSFTHNHVNRGNVTGIFGDTVDMTSGSYNGGFTVDVNPEWNTDNLQVVAFISAYSPEDVTDCRIYNTAVCDVTPSGVSEIPASETIATECYTLQGTRATAEARGVLIEIRHHADGTSTRSVVVRE